MNRHLVLVGLSGAGKSTIGPLVAKRLGIPFVDLDSRIEESAGRSVAGVFADGGEPAFRELERQQMRQVLAGAPAVVATGGGWAAEPGNIEEAAAMALTVYLRVSPVTAAARLTGAGDRPLLVGGNLEDRLEGLHRVRDPWYRRAMLTVDADTGTPAMVAERVAGAALEYQRSLSAAR